VQANRLEARSYGLHDPANFIVKFLAKLRGFRVKSFDSHQLRTRGQTLLFCHSMTSVVVVPFWIVVTLYSRKNGSVSVKLCCIIEGCNCEALCCARRWAFLGHVPKLFPKRLTEKNRVNSVRMSESSEPAAAGLRQTTENFRRTKPRRFAAGWQLPCRTGLIQSFVCCSGGCERLDRRLLQMRFAPGPLPPHRHLGNCQVEGQITREDSSVAEGARCSSCPHS